MNIEYTAHIWQEGTQFVAHAMPLDVMSAGRTPEQARQALDEAVRLFLATAADMQTLEDVLEEAGYELDEVPVSIIRNNLKTANLSREEYFRLLQQS